MLTFNRRIKIYYRISIALKIEEYKRSYKIFRIEYLDPVSRKRVINLLLLNNDPS